MFRNTLLAWSRNAKPVVPMVKHPFKVHVWAAISVKGKIGIHLFTENLDRHLYRKILNDNLYDNANALYGRRWVFQQDNDHQQLRFLANGCSLMLVFILVPKGLV